MTDQILYCRDCHQKFIFTTGEQEFYASRGWPNVPGRCPECRAVHKQARGERNSWQRKEYQEQKNRPIYTTTCARCGREAQVPFQPEEGRPVYCNSCFQPHRTHSAGGSISRG